MKIAMASSFMMLAFTSLTTEAYTLRGSNVEMNECPTDTHYCPDGSTVERDPANNCEFAVCPQISEDGEQLLGAPDSSLIGLDEIHGDLEDDYIYSEYNPYGEDTGGDLVNDHDVNISEYWAWGEDTDESIIDSILDDENEVGIQTFDPQRQIRINNRTPNQVVSGRVGWLPGCRTTNNGNYAPPALPANMRHKMSRPRRGHSCPGTGVVSVTASMRIGTRTIQCQRYRSRTSNPSPEFSVQMVGTSGCRVVVG